MAKVTIFPLLILTLLSASLFAQSPSDEVTENSLENDELLATKQLVDSGLIRIKGYFYDSNYEKVIEETPALIELSDAINYKSTATKLRSGLGNAFIQIDEFERAEEIFNQALTKAKATGDNFEILSSYNNLGNTYITSNPEKAIMYLKQGMDVLEQQGAQPYSNMMSFMFNNNLSELYVGTKEVEKASYHSNKALDVLENTEGIGARQEEALSVIYFVQGNIKILENDPKGAIKAINKSLEIGKDKLDENYLLGNYKNLIDAYDKTNRLVELNAVRKTYDSLKDKIYEAEKIRQQQIARSKYNIDKYQQEVRESQLHAQLSDQKASKNKLLFTFTAITSGIMIVLITFLLLARFKRNRLVKDLQTKNKQYLEAKDKSEKLAQSNTRFLSTISHELRTPLYGIIGLSSVLLKNTKKGEHQEQIESLKFSADYLLALVNDVLNINKFESSEGRVLSEDHFILKDLIEGIVQSFEFINKKNNNEVRISIDSQLPAIVVGDKMKISQVLMNLVSNASKFTEDGKLFISVKIETLGPNMVTASFTVKDTGPGIAEEEQRKIFEEFTQLKEGVRQGGTGLGLPIVKKVLDILGSKLYLKSDRGQGTEFSFTMDLRYGLESKLKVSMNEVGREQLKNKRILIVDDNKINQMVTQKVLEQNGMKHKCADNGLEAIKMVRNSTYDAILMDINMPVLNGIEASKRIREFNSTIPIIALTATNFDHLDTTLFNNGIDDAIVKPYDTEQLLAVLIKYVVRLPQEVVA